MSPSKQETKPEVAAEPRAKFSPARQEDVDKERARIRAEQDERLPRMLDCLDPAVAKKYEDAKNVWEWRVTCRMFRPAVGRSPARMEEITKEVVAQNQRDAWAMFCDLVGEYPSIRGARPKIERLRKRTLRDPAPELAESES